MLAIKGLNTHYGASHIFAGRRPESSRWPYRGTSGPQRCRQKHDVTDGDGACAVEWRVDRTGWGQHHGLAPASGGACRRRLCAGGTADLSRPLGHREHQGRGTNSRPRMAAAQIAGVVPGVAGKSAPIAAPICRAASSRCWRSPGLWFPIQKCCCWMSPVRDWHRWWFANWQE